MVVTPSGTTTWPSESGVYRQPGVQADTPPSAITAAVITVQKGETTLELRGAYENNFVTAPWPCTMMTTNSRVTARSGMEGGRTLTRSDGKPGGREAEQNRLVCRDCFEAARYGNRTLHVYTMTASRVSCCHTRIVSRPLRDRVGGGGNVFHQVVNKGAVT